MKKSKNIETIRLDEEQAKKLRECQVKMLDAVVEICNNNNLTYVLLAGTCLGAVRHKGFIPWDDDIDIGLPREDYDKLLLIANEVLPENMFCQTFENEKEYPLLYAKIRLNDSIFLERSIVQSEMHHGVFIDIFPIDGCSKSLNLAKRFFRKVWLRKNVIFLKKVKRPKSKLTLKGKIKRCLFAIYSFFFTIKSCYKSLNNLLKKYTVSNSSYIGNLFGAWKMKEVMRKEVMFGVDMQTTQVEFEGKIYNAPYDTHAYLTSLYGDYMTPPPPEKRISHHDIIAIQFPQENDTPIEQDV